MAKDKKVGLSIDDGNGGLIPPIEVIPGGGGSDESTLPHIIYDGDYINPNPQLKPRIQTVPATPIPNKVATWSWITENYPNFLKFNSNNYYYRENKGIKKSDAEHYYFLDDTVYANKDGKRLLLETDIVPKRARGFNGPATVCCTSISQYYALIGGHFTECNGFPAPKIALINVSSDPGLYYEIFHNNIGSGPAGDIFAIESCHETAHNGELSFLVGGNFTSFNGNTAYKGLVKINVSNSDFRSTQFIDTTFNIGTGFNGNVLAIKRHPKLVDKYFVAGNFTTYRGVSAPYICLLNGDGTLNTTDFKRTNFTGPINHIMIPHDLSYSNNELIPHMYVSGNFSIVDYFGETIWNVVSISLDGLYINRKVKNSIGNANLPLRPNGYITGSSNTGTDVYVVHGNFSIVNNTTGFGGVYVGNRYNPSKNNTKVVYNDGNVTRILTAKSYVAGTNGSLGYEYKRTFVFGSFRSFSVMNNGTYPQNIATWYYSGMHISTKPELTDVLTYGNPPGHGSGFHGGVNDAVLISRSNYIDNNKINDKILVVGDFREYRHQGTTYYCNYAILLDGANGKPDNFFLEYFDERNLNL